MSFGTLTGKSQLIGFGNPQAFPITLDPVVYEGAVVYADNDKLYFSDGTQWIELLGGGGQTVDAILPFAFISEIFFIISVNSLNPSSVILKPPSGSSFLESKPADIKISSGLNFSASGKRSFLNAFIISSLPAP